MGKKEMRSCCESQSWVKERGLEVSKRALSSMGLHGCSASLAYKSVSEVNQRRFLAFLGFTLATRVSLG